MDTRSPFTPADLRALHAASLGPDAAPMVPAMALALAASFGSAERWREAFAALARAHGERGWALLSFLPREGRLVNHRVAAHAGAPADGVPLLALPLHGPDGAVGAGAVDVAAVDARIDRIDWAAVYERYQAAVHDASGAFAATADDLAGATVLDVRRRGVFEQAQVMLPGARWCDPATVGAWANELAADRPVIVYCIYGHEVGRATALRLRSAGVDARYLSGGIDAWQAAGRPLVDKAPGAVS